MSERDADRNLLFGVLAVQMDFADASQLVAAMNAWMLDKRKGIGDVLVGQGVLTESDRDLLAGLVDRHVQLHADDVRQSLAAVRMEPTVQRSLAALADADVRQSLASLPGTVYERDTESVAGAGPPSQAAGQPTSAGARFRILRPHAEGGLGTVSVALDTELNREVAFKEIKPSRADDVNSRGRFVLEAEVTGGLEHPAIVPVYGFGTHADGRPFYAMRFIRGSSLKDAIAEFHSSEMTATQRNLAFRELLDRFTDVCQAVEYAHSRGVLHRDIKPDNVMLGRYGETLVVDWGLAKPTGDVQGETEASLAPLTPSGEPGSAETVAGTAMGTPQYMPPEQAEGRPDLLSARSDVYALGATLATLLCGQVPVAGADLQSVLAGVREGRVITRGPAPEGVPRSLWAVCDRAMARDAKDRYGSPRELAAEVERYLADEPVTAVRDPLGVRARRWVRKHPGLSTGVAASVLLLLAFSAVGFAVVSGFNRDLRRAQAEAVGERERAEENFEAARQAVQEYLVKVTDNQELKQAGFRDLRAELLRSAQPFYERLRDQRPGDAAVESSRAEAFYRLAYIQHELGEFQRAERNYRECLAVYRRLADAHPDVPEYASDLARGHNNLGLLLADLGDRQGARREYDSALAIFERLAEAHPDVPEFASDLARGHNHLGTLLAGLGDGEGAQREYEAGLAIFERLTRAYPDVPGYAFNLARSHNNLGVLLRGLGDGEGARRQYQAALTIKERLAEAHPGVPGYAADLAGSHNNLGNVLAGLGDVEGASWQYQAALTIYRRLSESHPDVPRYASDLAGSHNNLGLLLKDTGDNEGAQREYGAALAIRRRLAGSHPGVPAYDSDLAESHLNLGGLLAGLGDGDAAKREYDAALAIFEGLAEAHRGVPEYRVMLGGGYCNYGSLVHPQDPAGALPWFDRAEEVLRGVLDDQPRDATARLFLRNTLWGRAGARERLARYAEAAADWEESAELDDGRQKAALQQQAARSRAMAEQAEHFESILAGEAEPADAEERIALAGYCYAKKQYLEAARQHRQAYAEKPDLAEANRYNAACCAALALADLKPDQRAEWRKQALAWLQADLEALAENSDTEATKKSLAHWLQDKDLAAVREQSALEPLPEDERQQWQSLWQAVREAAE